MTSSQANERYMTIYAVCHMLSYRKAGCLSSSLVVVLLSIPITVVSPPNPISFRIFLKQDVALPALLLVHEIEAVLRLSVACPFSSEPRSKLLRSYWSPTRANTKPISSTQITSVPTVNGGKPTFDQSVGEKVGTVVFVFRATRTGVSVATENRL